MEPMELCDNSSSIDIIGHNINNAYFDEVIGHIEDIVLCEAFVTLHTHFLEKYWRNFQVNEEENQLVHMDIYLEYVTTFENFLIKELHKRMENFDMQRFAEELNKSIGSENKQSYDEIFELLHSFNDFNVFKELILDYRFNKEHKSQRLDLNNILVTKPMFLEDDQEN